MKQIYLIAQDEIIPSDEVETRVCHNLGAFMDEGKAQDVADRHNKAVKDIREQSESYYVLPVEIKD